MQYNAIYTIVTNDYNMCYKKTHNYKLQVLFYFTKKHQN